MNPDSGPEPEGKYTYSNHANYTCAAFALSYKSRPMSLIKLFSPLFFNKTQKSFNKQYVEMFGLS